MHAADGARASALRVSDENIMSAIAMREADAFADTAPRITAFTGAEFQLYSRMIKRLTPLPV